MKSKEFVARLYDAATNYKTLYVRGCFGAPMTEKNKERYIKANSWNATEERAAMIRAATKDTFGFDCVCLLKGILWGWNGNVNKTYGGAVYESNGVPDLSYDAFAKKCPDLTSDWSKKLDPGEIVVTDGHIGAYIGNGLCVESTPKWANKVQITACGNLGEVSGYPTRTWLKHGHSPYIDYSDLTPPAVDWEAKYKQLKAAVQEALDDN